MDARNFCKAFLGHVGFRASRFHVLAEPIMQVQDEGGRRQRAERGAGLQPLTIELAEYVVVLTSLNPKDVPAVQVLALYRGRWQIELVFKRLKSLLGVGDLAKYDPDSAKAWLQPKLLTALLLERLEREAFFFSPGDTRSGERSRWREFREVRVASCRRWPRRCPSNNSCSRGERSDPNCASVPAAAHTR